MLRFHTQRKYNFIYYIAWKRFLKISRFTTEEQLAWAYRMDIEEVWSCTDSLHPKDIVLSAGPHEGDQFKGLESTWLELVVLYLRPQGDRATSHLYPVRTQWEGAISELEIALSRHRFYHHPGPGFPASKAIRNKFLLLVNLQNHFPLNKLRPLLTAGQGDGLLLPPYQKKLCPALQISAALPL